MLKSAASAATAGQPLNAPGADHVARYDQAQYASAPTNSAPPSQTSRRSCISDYYNHMGHPGGARIVISGIGVVSPFGVGRERFWQSVSRGCSGTRTITDFDTSEFACRVAAPVAGVSIDDVPPIDGDDLWDPGYRA